jgi:LDH2 family malate/lactate/ureidoglycolate dehydrogenase
VPDTPVSAPKLKAFVVEVLEKVGISSEDAQTTAEILVTTDMRGTRTHGVRLLKWYVDQIQRGGVNRNARMEIVRSGPTWALVDGQAALGEVTAYKSMKLAMAKAKGNFIGVVGVRNSNHFGAAGYYANMCLEQDVIGFAMTNADPSMSVPGAAARLFGTNPLAYAFPASQEKGLTFDVATSVVAGVKIHQAAREGRRIPEGWIIDRQGRPTTDPTDLEKGGAHLPVGGHKGYGLAFMIEVLTGAFTGSGVMDEVFSYVQYPDRSCNSGHFFMAIDVDTFIPVAEFKARLDAMAHKIRNSPKVEGVERIYVPGEIEAEEQEKGRVRGVLLDETTLSDLKQVADDLGIWWEPF